MSTYVVTGAASFIGVPLCRQLLENGHRVVAVVRPCSPHNARLPQHERLRVLQRDRHALSTLTEDIGGADGLFHLMWDGVHGAARQDDARQQSNADDGLEAVRLAIRLGCSVFVGSGSQAEYGRQEGRITADTPACPVTAYGRAKWRCCTEGTAAAQAAGMRFVWPRIFSLYGENDEEHTLVMTVLNGLLSGRDVPLTACTQLWDYLYVRDAAQMLCGLAENPSASGIYPLAGGCSQPLRTYAQAIRTAIGAEGRLLFGAVPYGPEGPVGFTVDMQKTAAALGSLPHTDFCENVRRMAQQLANQKNG